jgi:hypothetical protein
MRRPRTEAIIRPRELSGLGIPEPTAAERAQWREEFEAAAKRPLRTRFRYAFIKTYKPVLDDESYRSFDSTADYRRWCEANLPAWLGYGRAV